MRVRIGRPCYDSMVQEGRLRYPRETGGVLLGHLVARARLIEVLHAVGPGPNATRSTDRFCPDHDYHDGEVAAAYRASGGRVVYLGDWHTHPTADAYLSELDVRTLTLIARSPEARAPAPLMLVLSGQRDRWAASAWVGRLRRSFWGVASLRVTAAKVEIVEATSCG